MYRSKFSSGLRESILEAGNKPDSFFSHGYLCRGVTNSDDGIREIVFSISFRPVADAPERRLK